MSENVYDQATDPGTAVTTGVSVRPGKSARTRQALREAALRHFAAHGVDGANVPLIAAEVGVTERTFYRHFATKDEVLFGDLVTRLAWFNKALHERPADEDVIRSVLAALSAAPIDPRLMIQIARLRAELLSPDRIETTFRDRQGAMARELRLFLRERGTDDLTATVRAEALAGAVFGALTVWNDGTDHQLADLSLLTEQALELLRPMLQSEVRPEQR